MAAKITVLLTLCLMGSLHLGVYCADPPISAKTDGATLITDVDKVLAKKDCSTTDCKTQADALASTADKDYCSWRDTYLTCAKDKCTADATEKTSVGGLKDSRCVATTAAPPATTTPAIDPTKDGVLAIGKIVSGLKKTDCTTKDCANEAVALPLTKSTDAYCSALNTLLNCAKDKCAADDAEKKTVDDLKDPRCAGANVQVSLLLLALATFTKFIFFS